MPRFDFPGLVPGDRWCVTAHNWARAYQDGSAAPVVLASTNAAVLDIVPIEALREHAVDVPPTRARSSPDRQGRSRTRTIPPSVATYADPSGPSVTAE